MKRRNKIGLSVKLLVPVRSATGAVMADTGDVGVIAWEENEAFVVAFQTLTHDFKTEAGYNKVWISPHRVQFVNEFEP